MGLMYAQEVTVLEAGLRVGPEAMSQIGVADGSICWGLWVPDRQVFPGKSSRSTRDHLLVSPFEPASWPVLVRIEIYLRNDDRGMLASALEALNLLKAINIVSLEAAPAGHHHAVVTIIAESIEAKSSGMLDPFKRLPESKRTFKCEQTWAEVHNSFANVMLAECDRIERHLVYSNATCERKFLREIFLSPADPLWQKGVLYSPDELPAAVAEVGSRQATRAVSCNWLQNLAFFWLYGRKTENEAIEFEYDGSSELLKPSNSERARFKAEIQSLDPPPPLRTIGSFHRLEKFFRLVMSPEDSGDRTARIIIPYEAHYKPPADTRGFQFELYKRLALCNLNLRHVSMFTRHRTLATENGYLSMLVSNADGSPFSDLSALKAEIDHAARGASENLVLPNSKMRCDPATVLKFSARKLFVSTKFDWLKNKQVDLYDNIRLIAERHGFHAVSAQNELKAEQNRLIPEARKYSQSVTAWTNKLIRHSDAFLQVIPRSVLADKKTDQLNWLLFEFGAALALDIPHRILVDCDASVKVEKWQKKLRVGSGIPLQEFDSSAADSDLLGAIDQAVASLSMEF